MNIEDLEKVVKLASLLKKAEVDEPKNDDMWHVGRKYFIRTVTMYLVGKLTKVTDKEMLLEDASWVADTGRFHDALKTGNFSEIEPFINDVIVNRNSVIDATEWRFDLPTKQK